MLFFSLHAKCFYRLFGIYFVFQVKKIENFCKFMIQYSIYGTFWAKVEYNFREVEEQKQSPYVCYKKTLKYFAIFTAKHLCWRLFLIKLQDRRPATLLERDSNTSLLLLILQNFKNAYFEEHLRTTVSGWILESFAQVIICILCKSICERLLKDFCELFLLSTGIF